MYFCIGCFVLSCASFFFLPLRRAGVLRKCLLKTIPALKSCHSNAWLNGRTHSLPKVFALIFGAVCLKARGVLELRVHAKRGLKSCPLESPAHPQHTRFLQFQRASTTPPQPHPGPPPPPYHIIQQRNLYSKSFKVFYLQIFFPSPAVTNEVLG